MRLQFISQYFHPEQFSNSRIAKGLVDRGVEVEVICCVPNYPEGVFYDGYSNKVRRHETWNGVSIHRVRTIPRGKRARQLIANYLAYAFFSPFKAFRLARKQRPDAVFVSLLSPISQASAGIFIKKIFGVPLVYWVQDIWPESATVNYNIKSPLIVRPLTWICGWFYRQADLVLVQSQAFPPMITRFGVSESDVQVFPNSAAPLYRPVAPEDARSAEALVSGNGFKIMFAGNIGSSQGFDNIIETADLLVSRRLIDWIIIGEGRDLPRVKAMVREKGLENRFKFLGRHPEDSMPSFFAHADAMLVSLAKSEIFSLTVPYKVQSYMACGKPIIASMVGEGARVIEDAKAGVTAAPDDPHALADRICELIDSGREALNEMGGNARAFYDENYDETHLMDSLHKTLVRLKDP